MFEKFRFGKKKEENLVSKDTQLTEIEDMFSTVFTVETRQNSLEELIRLGNISCEDQRITKKNFPRQRQEQHFNAKILGGIRDSSLEDVEGDLHKEGFQSATLHELLEFMPHYPKVLERLYALGSILEENSKKFCVKIVKKDTHYSLSLEELGGGTTKEGETYYYAPWPSAFLAVKKL